MFRKKYAERTFAEGKRRLADGERRRTEAESAERRAREFGQWWLLQRQDKVIATSADRPLRERLQHAIWVGGPDLESEEDWIARKQAVVDERMRLWQARDIRYGMVLLDLVEQQGGVCGDPAKDPQKHGCGCWLLALPPGTVHVDHITPRALGGTDAPDNLQALCHSCNLVKGAKTEKPDSDEVQQGPSL